MAEFDALGVATRVASSPLAADEAYEVKHAWHETIHTFGGRGNDGSVELVFVETADHGEVSFIAKAIQGTMNGEVLDQETTTFDAEAAFYGKGHALTLLEAGCRVPQPLLVEQGMHGLELLICITKLEGEMLAELDMHQLERVVRWLARMHAAYWGHSRADTAVAPGGLRPHGGYWSTEQCGIEGLPTDGWEGRLRIAAKSIEDRVRAFPLTTVVHGDVKEGNIIHDEDGDTVGLIDFEYTGKACAAEDLARLLHCMGGTPEPTPELVSLVLGQYHSELCARLAAMGEEVTPSARTIADAFDFACADLARFMSGEDNWWGHEDLLRARAVALLDRLDGGTALEGGEEEYAAAVWREFPKQEM